MTSKNASKAFPLNLPEGDPDLLLHELQTRLREGRRLFAEVGQILAEIESRGVRDLFGYNSIAVFYEHAARVSRAEARKVTARAVALNSRHARDGTSIPPVAPLTGAAAAKGLLADGGIDRIVTVMRRLPEHIAASARVDAERTLVDLAGVARPRDVTIAGNDEIGRHDPDSKNADDSKSKGPRREFWLRRKRTGRWDMRGDLDSETGARLNALLVPLAHQAPNGEADQCTPAERRGDAFAEIVDLADSSPDIPMPRQNSERVAEPSQSAKSAEKPLHRTKDDQTGQQDRRSQRHGTVSGQADNNATERSRDVAHIRPPRWWSRLSRPRSNTQTPSTKGNDLAQSSDENVTDPQLPKTA
ncbi:DUF222 domain-containing protein [Amycolatopsis sp. NPDC051071]|uniref:DUF222 domain-containing protein n=1 Tax=Amycolatopsis sp. NPDC051071 TaxID=3154637 RepID=UPI00343A0D47